jgi:hypothetical protein
LQWPSFSSACCATASSRGGGWKPKSSQPFKLRDLDDIQPAGDYLLDTDEELIEGLSRLAYRRVATLLHLPSTSRPQGRTEVVSVSPAELDAALEKDRIGRA